MSELITDQRLAELESMSSYDRHTKSSLWLRELLTAIYALRNKLKQETARADALQKRLDRALRLVARWKSNKHPQNKDWDDGWDKAELNCSFELQQALEDKP